MISKAKRNAMLESTKKAQQELASGLKTILHSKRANLYYLEHCRILQKDGRVLYLTEGEKANLYYNIPIANTTCLLLGTGTSITQSAMRLLSQAGVLVGFCGSGGTPLLMGNEIEWLSPQSEYRPTQYVQDWLSWWFDDNIRLKKAKILQLNRLQYIIKIWQKDKEFKHYGFGQDIENILKPYEHSILTQTSTQDLLTLEGRITKHLYKLASQYTKLPFHNRIHDNPTDKANQLLNHGNYLAYGLGATTAWVLGIPHGFALLHGKTRRGALVFDIADMIKDAIILPLAFICAKENDTQSEFRQTCLNYFTDYKVLDYLFEQVKLLSQVKLLASDDMLVQNQ